MSEMRDSVVRPPTLAQAGVEAEQEEDERQRHLPTWFLILWRNMRSRFGMFLLLAFILVAIFAPLLAPYNPRDNTFMPTQLPSTANWLGTTQSGEDVLSQLIYGARTSLLVGILAGAGATLIGLVIGLIAGYVGGLTDEILSFFINLALVIPALPLMIVIAAYSPVKGIWVIIIVIIVTGWAWGARVKRAQMVTLRERDYITAAVFAGDSMPRIVFREILPNMMSLVIAAYIGAASAAIGAEASLEFIGVGDPTVISWGTMSYWANNSGALLTGQWLWIAAPGLALALLITSLALINFGIDALSNPKLREE
jgi:peptide/nickel transport system permease protein